MNNIQLKHHLWGFCKGARNVTNTRMYKVFSSIHNLDLSSCSSVAGNWKVLYRYQSNQSQ